MIKNFMIGMLSLWGLTAKSQMPWPYVIPNTDWIKYYGARGASGSAPSALDVNSNAYSTGYTGTSTNGDLVGLKYDSTGVLQYSYTYNNGGHDVGNAIKIDNSGNSYIAGVSYHSVSGLDYFVVKLSPNGTMIWTKRFDRGTNRTDEAIDICVDASGSVYVVGKTQNSSLDYDITTLKLNGTNGSVIWQHHYNGSSLDDLATGMVLSANGQYVYVTGSTRNGSTAYNMVTYALNASNGTNYWSPVISNGTANGNDKSNGIIRSGANIVVCGEVNNTGTGLDYKTIMYNGTTGAIIWQQTYDYGTINNRATALVNDSTGNIGVVGTAINGTIYEYHTVLYSPAGTLYATNKESTGLTGSNIDPKIANDTIAHHWYVCGEISKTTKDIFVYQIAPSGNTAWRQTIDGQNMDIDLATDIAVNGVGVVYVGAQSKNSSANYDYTTIKLNQTPVYWPPDFAAEPVNYNHLYLKNKGQLVKTNNTSASNVLYYTHHTNPSIYIEQNSFNFVFNRTDTVLSTLDTLEKIQYTFLGANPLANHHEFLPKGTTYNYFLGYAAATSVPDIKGNERIFVPNFYPYIDLHYFSCKTGIKYYLVVKPGASLKDIRMQINGSTGTLIDGTTGNLKIGATIGSIELNRPIAYTVNMLGQVVTIPGSASWTSLGGTMYSITPPTYTASLPLIIEVSPAMVAASPSGISANLDYSTYYGGSSNDVFNDVSGAANGDRHVTGYETAGAFPLVNAVNFYSGSWDAVLLKYTADDTLRYATYMGGGAQDFANSVATDSQGNVFIGGQTFSTDMLGVNVTGATNQFNNGGASSAFKADGFIAKFNPAGTTMVWRRYFGGSGSETINSLFIDGSDNIYIAGYSSSFDCPVVNAFKATLGATTTANPSNTDAIFGKFNSSLTAQWITYYGGSANSSFGSATQDWGYDIVVDNSGRVIGCGLTDANNLSTVNSTGNPNTFFDNSISGSSDGFLVRYSSAGTPDFSSYFGGSNSDNVNRLVYKSNLDELYFAGDGYPGTGFPFVTKSGAFNSTYSPGGRTAFVGYMDGSLTKQWNTYYGHGQSGTKTYNTTGLSVDNSGLVYLSGWTTSDSLNFPTTTPVGVYTDVTRSSDDGYVAVFTPGKQLYHAHYFGGTGGDRILNTSIAANSKLYVTGYTSSNNFPIAYTPITAALIDSTYNAGQDGFISRFDLPTYQIIGIQKYDFGSNMLTVYPNPAYSQINIELSEDFGSTTNLKVYTLMGQLIFDKEITDKNTQINCESWSNGVYLISVNNKQSQKTFKLIKQ